MNNDHFTPEEQQLIDQLQALSKPRLDPAARETIHQRMVGELRTLTLDGQQPLSAPPAQLPMLTILLIGVIVVIIVVILVVVQANRSVTESPSVTATLVVSSTHIPPTRRTETAFFTATTTGATVTPAATNTPLKTVITETVDVTAIFTITPDLTRLVSTPTPMSGIVIEGPIANITENTLTIYDFIIQLAPTHPMLNILNVGDVVRVEGLLSGNGIVRAELISNVVDADAGSTVSVEGPVEAVDGRLITVNNIQIQLEANDPLLPTLQVGQFVSVQGNFQENGTTIVLVVVNITVLNNVVIEGNPACWYHADGMGMGHWHCDGMGMGDAMGMGEDGMGMGDAMGMGN